MTAPEGYGGPESTIHEYPAYGFDGLPGGVFGTQYQRRSVGTGKSIGQAWWGQPDGSGGLKAAGHSVVDLGLAGAELLPADLAGITLVLGEGPNFARVVGEALEPPYRTIGTWGAPHRPADAALERLIGCDAVLLAPDCDQPGIKQMTELGQRLVELGVSTKVVPFATGAREHDDLVDYFRAGGDLPSQLAMAVPFADSELCEPVATLAAIPDFPLDSLPAQAREIVKYGLATYRVPMNLTAGACMAALAAAIGPNATITTPSWFGTERAILWIPLIGPAGLGKKAAQRIALAQIRRHDRVKMPAYKSATDEWRAKPYSSRGSPPQNPMLTMTDTTLEALSDRLNVSNGAGCLDLDELAQLLRGLGEYKHGGGDRYRLLGLWSGEPWVVSRIAAGRSIYIPNPQLVIVGGLTTENHAMMGGPADGLRPRFLPHLAAQPPEVVIPDGYEDAPSGWDILVNSLLNCRSRAREWTVNGHAGLAFERHRKRWQDQSRNGDESPSTASALLKADTHLLRAILVLAEGNWPGQTQQIPVELVDAAADWIDFTLDCWRALPEADDGLTLSFRDKALNPRVDALLAYLERVGTSRSRRDLQRAKIARTGAELDAVIEAYGDTYPGCVWGERQAGRGGSVRMMVRAPERHPAWGGKRAGAGRKEGVTKNNQIDWLERDQGEKEGVTRHIRGNSDVGVLRSNGVEKGAKGVEGVTNLISSWGGEDIKEGVEKSTPSTPSPPSSRYQSVTPSAPLVVGKLTPAEARDRLWKSASVDELRARSGELKPSTAGWPRAILDDLNQVWETRLEELEAQSAPEVKL